jgi:peptidoglycan hydrolase-like protein with peptidoglycan-binding domain
MVARVQEQLKNLGYYQVGAIDGGLMPKGKTEDAILAFRNKNGLPLTPTIDDEFLNALAKATPPEIAEERATATAQDLREQGSKTIDLTDKFKGWAGKLFGASSGTGAGVLAVVTERATAVGQARDAISGLGLTPQLMTIIGVIVLALVVCAGVGLLIWHVADIIERKRVADYRIGKHT